MKPLRASRSGRSRSPRVFGVVARGADVCAWPVLRCHDTPTSLCHSRAARTTCRAHASGTASTTMTVKTLTTSSVGTDTINVTGTDSSTSPLLTPSTSVTLSVTSTALQSMTVSVSAGSVVHHGSCRVPLTVTNSSGGISGAGVTLAVYSGSTCKGSAVTTGSATTSSSDVANFSVTTKQTGTWCASATVTATGYNSGSGSKTFTTPSSVRELRRPTSH